jgi:hypothetical protein
VVSVARRRRRPPFNTTMPVGNLRIHVIAPETDFVWATSGAVVDMPRA